MGEDEMSMFTVNAYMADVPRKHGGATRFFHDMAYGQKAATPVLVVQPEAGLAVVFRQPPHEFLPHDGEQLKDGTKFLIRTDVLYRREGVYERWTNARAGQNAT